MAIISNVRNRYIISDYHDDERVNIVGAVPMEIQVISRRHGVEVLGLPTLDNSVSSLSSIGKLNSKPQ